MKAAHLLSIGIEIILLLSAVAVTGVAFFAMVSEDVILPSVVHPSSKERLMLLGIALLLVCGIVSGPIMGKLRPHDDSYIGKKLHSVLLAGWSAVAGISLVVVFRLVRLILS